MYIGLRVKHPLFLSGFNEICIFHDRFSKITQITNFMTVRPEGGSCSTRTEGQTDRHDKA